jgi:hypothetical protein
MDKTRIREEVTMDEEYRGFNITIEQDQDAFDPRKEYDNVGTMVCFHNRYDLGDKHSYTDPEEALRDILEIEWDYDDDYEINELWDKLEKVAYVLPLFLYDHSGITMSTSAFSCPWDSGQVGFIYAMKDTAEKEWSNATKEKCLSYLEGEVETYDQYLTGDVYGFTVEDPEGYVDDDSCWGFYGYDYCLEEARSVVDWMQEERTKAKIQEEIDQEKEDLKRYKRAWFPMFATTA